ncbi:MAG: hypothetical protein M3519_11080 [Actinomycetota bacterium]|nr:hypothetical protein [Actinomycetota bacterium]
MRDAFRNALRKVPGIEPSDWTPRDLRHSLVSLTSGHGIPLEEISRIVGHSGTAVTEAVCRPELPPVIRTPGRAHGARRQLRGLAGPARRSAQPLLTEPPGPAAG